MKRELTCSEAINEATAQCMEKDKSVFIIGEGVPDPKAIFGTTKGLMEKFGPERVMDMPISENALTGACVGAALKGLRPIITHQRIDFLLLPMDQIINSAAKWNYVFAGKKGVPIVIRTVIGRGWGQGAQHSQNIQALFAHIPGLKVVMPSTAYDAKGLLIESIKDNNPVLFIEHRWVHMLRSYVPEEMYTIPFGKANIVTEGTDITIVSSSYMTLEARKAIKYLKESGISAELIDLRTLKPLDTKTIINSVKKTGRLLVIDSGYYTGGFAGEIISQISENALSYLKVAPQRITLPDIPTPTSRALTKHYYPTYKDIISQAHQMLEKPEKEINKLLEAEESKNTIHDAPDKSFTGPF